MTAEQHTVITQNIMAQGIIFVNCQKNCQKTDIIDHDKCKVALGHNA